METFLSMNISKVTTGIPVEEIKIQVSVGPNEYTPDLRQPVATPQLLEQVLEHFMSYSI